MLRLIIFLHSLIGPTLAGTAVVVSLVAGIGGLWTLLFAAGVGYLLGIPVSWIIARRLWGEDSG